MLHYVAKMLKKCASDAFSIPMNKANSDCWAFIRESVYVLWSLIVSSAFNLNQRLELNDSRSRCCQQAVKVETDDRHKHIDTHDTTGVMVVECIPTTPHTGRYLQEESGAGKLESLRSRSRLSLFRRADVHEGEKTRSFCTPFAGEMEALRDALAVGKGRAGKRKRANYDEETLRSKMAVK